jgi:hypothetical protein
MNTRPDGMKRRQPRKHELQEIVVRLFGDLTIFDSMTVPQLREYIRLHGYCEISGQLFEGGRVDYDHKTPNAMLYKDDRIEWQVLHPDAHKDKTKSDRKKIAKCDRLMGRTGQVKRRKERKTKGKRPLIQSNPKIQSRGFSKPPDGYSAFKRKPANIKHLDEL